MILLRHHQKGLCIDEFKGNAGGEKYRTTLTDAQNLKIADMLPNRKRSDLTKYFLRFENRILHCAS